jgi:hypothetical protein
VLELKSVKLIHALLRCSFRLAMEKVYFTFHVARVPNLINISYPFIVLVFIQLYIYFISNKTMYARAGVDFMPLAVEMHGATCISNTF